MPSCQRPLAEEDLDAILSEMAGSSFLSWTLMPPCQGPLTEEDPDAILPGATY